MDFHKLKGKNRVSHSAHEQEDTVDRNGDAGIVALGHPTGAEWDEREPKEEVIIGPEDRTSDSLYGLEHVVVVVPVDTKKDETEDVAANGREEGGEVGESESVGGPEL